MALGVGVGHRKSKRGFAQTIYFQYGDEILIDELKARIDDRTILDTRGRQFTSFSALVREAFREKLERGVVGVEVKTEEEESDNE